MWFPCIYMQSGALAARQVCFGSQECNEANALESWNANKLGQSISVYTVMCIQVYFGVSVTTFDEPVRADLGLKTLKNRRDFCKLKC